MRVLVSDVGHMHAPTQEPPFQGRKCGGAPLHAKSKLSKAPLTVIFWVEATNKLIALKLIKKQDLRQNNNTI